MNARPASITTACILWIIYGGLGILGGVITLRASAGVGGFQIVFGLAFLVTGFQVLMGKASSVLGSGIVCIILGALALVGGLGGAAAFASSLIAIIVLVNAGLLIAAGVLAIVGSGAYKQWIATH